MNDEIDIRRPMASILRCPVCKLRRDLPLNWRELMNTQTITCVKDNVAMVEEVVIND